MTQKEFKQMIEEYLDNGAFDVSDYAQFEFSGLTAMLAEEWTPDRIAEACSEIKDRNDYDGLGDYAYEKARAEDLEPGHDYR